jgi:hypothetical protein
MNSLPQTLDDHGLGDWSEARFEELVTAEAMPVVALAACLVHFDKAAPKLRDVLIRAANGEALSESDHSLCFWGLHILAGGRDSLAYKPLLRLLHRPGEELDELLGDALTVTLPSIVVSLFDGDEAALFETIANRDVDAFVRWSLFSALAFRSFKGKVDKQRCEAFLARFDEESLANEDDQSWIGWLDAIGLLGLRAFADRVERRSKTQIIIDFFGDGVKVFYETLKRTEENPDDEARFADAHVGYIDDICDALEWVSFGEDEDEDWKLSPDEDRFVPKPEPAVNLFRNVGRNDPCPCGSGKKAKKCCLA